jgi:NAD-dependent deacetylase sirtuin 1
MAVPGKLTEAPSRIVRTVIDGVEEVAQLILQRSRILVLAGAGISASCGIPTFRDERGFYADTVKEFGLRSPEELSDINFFRQNPRPWFKKVSAIVPSSSQPRQPSLTHRFIRMLEERGKLLHLFTQNIDTLESVAGITRVTFCHGSFATATCMTCARSVDGAEINDTIASGEVPLCKDCNGTMKPDVVLFNEPMPPGVRDKIAEHVESADLLLVVGTSLLVTPCSLIPSLVGASGDAPRILINKEVAGKDSDFEGMLQRPCDDTVSELLNHLGWMED